MRILPIADRHHDYAYEVKKALEEIGMRVEVDTRNEKIGYKIREARLQRLPYMLTVGDSEVEAGTLSVRGRGENGDMGSMSIANFKAMCEEEIRTKAIK